MFLTGFVIALILCLPACIGSASLAESFGWEEATLWPLLSGLVILLLAGIAMLKRWQRDAKEVWFGGLFGVIVGSGVLWGLQLWS